MSRGAGSRILHGFANAVLGFGLPKIRAYLQQRLGAGAQLEQIEIDGARVHLNGAFIPLGGVAALHVSRATLWVDREERRLRLEALRGEIRVQGSERSPFHAPIAFEPDTEQGDDWVRGRLRVSEASWATHRGVGERAPLEGAIEVRLTPHSWSLDNGQFSSAEATVFLSAAGAMDNTADNKLASAKLVFRDARAGHFMDALIALTGHAPPVGWPLPWASLLTGELAVQRDRLSVDVMAREVNPGADVHFPDELWLKAELRLAPSLNGDVKLSTRESELELKPLNYCSETHSWAGTRLFGHLCAQDIEQLNLLSERLRPASESCFELDLAVEDHPAGPLLRGHARCASLSLQASTSAQPAARRAELALTAVTAELELSAAGVRLPNVVAQAYGGQLQAQLEWRREAEATLALQLVEVGAEALVAAFELSPWEVAVTRAGETRPATQRWIAAAAKLSGDLTLQNAGTASGSLLLETDSSTLLLKIAATADATEKQFHPNVMMLNGTTLRGRLSLLDAMRFGLCDTAVRPLLMGPSAVPLASLTGELMGSLEQPLLDLRLTAEEIWLAFHEAPRLPPLCLQQLSAHLRVTLDKVIYDDVHAAFYGGKVQSRGYALLREEGGYQSRLWCRGVAVETLPVNAQQTLAPHLAGLAHGEVVFYKQRDADALSGKGSVQIYQPQLRFVELARSRLRDVGLSPPSAHGDSPIEASFCSYETGWRVDDLKASVPGCRGRGGVMIRQDGALQGQFEVQLAARYLRQSPLLVIPAALGDIAVPVAVAGTLSDPTITTDLLGALGSAFVRNPVVGAVGGAVGGAMDEVMGAMDGLAHAASDFFSGTTRASATPHQHQYQRQQTGLPPRLQALVERLCQDDPDTDTFVDRLLDAGVSEEDIVRVLEARRMRFRG